MHDRSSLLDERATFTDSFEFALTPSRNFAPNSTLIALVLRRPVQIGGGGPAELATS